MSPIGPSGTSGSSGGWTQIYDNLLTGPSAGLNVTGISQAYRHLKIALSGRCDQVATDTQVDVQFNADTAANYDAERLVFSAVTVTIQQISTPSTKGIVGFLPGASANAGSGGSIEATILNYAETTFHKNLLALGVEGLSTAAGQPQTDYCSTRWRSTAAITGINIFPDAGNFIAGTRLSIYGI